MSTLVVLVVIGGVVGAASASRFRRKKRRREASVLASELVPEIRAILSESETRAAKTARYAQCRHRLAERLPRETVFAVETFYHCAEALVEASAAMTEAFSRGDEISLGDRIRAKDWRDRCLKDVYYSGEAAIQKLRSSC